MRLSLLAGLMFSMAAQAQSNPTPFDCQFSGTLTAASPTTTAPSAGNTAWYTKGGKLCSLSPASVEACTGSGGGPTTQTDVSGSRSFGVPYHNTLTTPLYVNISLLCGAGSVALSTDASSTPTTFVSASTNGTVVSNYQFVSGIVLPGNYYQAENACSGTTTYWIEWH